MPAGGRGRWPDRVLASGGGGPPVQQRIWRPGFRMVLELALDKSPDRDSLQGIAEKITHHSDIPGIRQFHQDRKIRSMVAQGLVGWTPDTLPAEDTAARLDGGPLNFEGMATMAEPFGPELPGPALRAALHQQPVLL